MMKKSTPPSSSEIEAPATMPAAKAERSAARPNLVDTLVLAVLFLALALTGWRLWSISGATETEPVVADSPSASMPVLKLHQDHERKGPEITVDPGAIGKENPFK